MGTFFTKNKSAEQSSLSGYYAKVRMQVEGGGYNEAPELFAVNMDMFESSNKLLKSVTIYQYTLIKLNDW